ncbi:phiSA1p31-related protein [Streptomyces sp. NPDC014733]|uniref:phiSA1p31-related protein n=1 Tax=Streptomyces sp. NPDC014733 TaxID=3364885 RepID=UPI0036FA9921
MFTIDARALEDLLDRVGPHCLIGQEENTLTLECSRTWLHAVVSTPATLVVARTPVEGGQWAAPLAAQDIAVLRGWLETCENVCVDYTTQRPAVCFTEGAAQMTAPVAPYASVPHWRSRLRAGVHRDTAATNPSASIRLSAQDLDLWRQAGDDVELTPTGRDGFIVTAGPDFIGLQTGQPDRHGRDDLEGWTRPLRPLRRFFYQGLAYEVGADYVDRWGTVWRITQRPPAGEEPYVALAGPSGACVPMSAVLKDGGPLVPLSTQLVAGRTPLPETSNSIRKAARTHRP